MEDFTKLEWVLSQQVTVVVQVIRYPTDGSYWVAGAPLASSLGYQNPRSVFKSRVSSENKKRLGEFGIPSGLQPRMIFINHKGCAELFSEHYRTLWYVFDKTFCQTFKCASVEIVDSIKSRSFSFEEREYQLRFVYDAQGNAWIYGIDATGLLGYKNSSDAIRKINQSFVQTWLVIRGSDQRGPSYMHDTNLFVNEAGFNELLLGSTLPNAKRFRAWLCETVIPEIWRTGKFDPSTRRIEDVTNAADQGDVEMVEMSAQLILEEKRNLEKQLTLVTQQSYEQEKQIALLKQRAEYELQRQQHEIEQQRQQAEYELQKQQHVIEQQKLKAQINLIIISKQYEARLVAAMFHLGQKEMTVQDTRKDIEKAKVELGGRICPKPYPGKQNFISVCRYVRNGKLIIDVSRGQSGRVGTRNLGNNFDVILYEECSNAMICWSSCRLQNPMFFLGVRFLNTAKTAFRAMSAEELVQHYAKELKRPNSSYIAKNYGITTEADLLERCLIDPQRFIPDLLALVRTVLDEGKRELATLIPIRLSQDYNPTEAFRVSAEIINQTVSRLPILE